MNEIADNTPFVVEVITEAEYLKALEVVKSYQKQVNDQVSSCTTKELPEHLSDMGFSTTAYKGLMNLLRWYKVDTSTDIRQQLSYITYNNLKATRGIGPTTTSEITSILSEYGVLIK